MQVQNTSRSMENDRMGYFIRSLSSSGPRINRQASCRQIFHAFWKLPLDSKSYFSAVLRYSPYFCDRRTRWKAWPLLVLVVIFMYLEAIKLGSVEVERIS